MAKNKKKVKLETVENVLNQDAFNDYGDYLKAKKEMEENKNA